MPRPSAPLSPELLPLPPARLDFYAAASLSPCRLATRIQVDAICLERPTFSITGPPLATFGPLQRERPSAGCMMQGPYCPARTTSPPSSANTPFGGRQRLYCSASQFSPKHEHIREWCCDFSCPQNQQCQAQAATIARRRVSETQGRPQAGVSHDSRLESMFSIMIIDGTPKFPFRLPRVRPESSRCSTRLG